MWSWYLASRAVTVLFFVPESGVLSDITYIGRVLAERGAAASLHEYPWPAAALFEVPLALGVTPGLQYYLSLIALFLAVDALFMLLLWVTAGRRMERGVVLWLLIGPLLGPLVVARFDAATGALAAAAVLMAARGRSAPAGVSLALGCALKLWPVLALPAVLAAARSRLRLLAGFVLAGAALFALGLYAAGMERLWSPLSFQGTRGLHVEALPALPLLWLRHFDPAPWATELAACRCYEIEGPGVALATQAAGIALALGLAAAALVHLRALRARAVDGPLAAELAALTVLVWICAGKVFSPQYLLWAAALLAMLDVLAPGRLGRAEFALFAAAAGLTHVVFPMNYATLTDAGPSRAWVLAVLTLRDAALVALAVRLGLAAWRHGAVAARPGATGGAP